ncbi:MAG: DUF6265 family protein [Pseudomonadota bacterium]
MTSRSFLFASVLLMVFASANTHAQSARTENTLRLDDPANQPAATFDAVSFLVGSWAGPAFGGTFEEVWNPPSAGSMVGMFKFMGDDAVGFYEIMLIVQEEDSLNLKVKHFNPDFSAWEEKEDYVNFRLVRVELDAVYFSGLTFKKISDDEIHAYIAFKSEAGSREEKLVFNRQ